MSIAAPLTRLVPSSKNAPTPTPSLHDEEQYWGVIRDQFPITREIVYLNNGTMGPSPRIVTDRVTSRIIHVDRTGEYGGNYDEVRKAIARVVNAQPEEIAFTHNVSEAISIISSGFRMSAGDEVILTDQEHGGNAVAWLARVKRDGIVPKFVTLAKEDHVTLERFEKAITPRTKIIAVPHLTCTTGQLLPAKELVELAHAKGIKVMLDGAHPPGMLTVDVKKLGADAYTSCGHKWLCGPKGIGFLYIAPSMLDEVMPTWSGAEADKHWDYSGKLEFLPTASRYDFATQNFALFDGLQTAIEWMESIGFAAIEDRVKSLSLYLRRSLTEAIPDKFTFLTPTDSITGLTTIKLKSMQYQQYATELMAKYKMRVRVVPESGLEANRLSTHIYTSKSDIDKFVDATKALLA